MKIKRLVFWVSLIFICDQLTKLLIVKWVSVGEVIPIIPHFFDIVHLTNPGAAFGFLGDLPVSYRFPLLVTVSLLAIGLIGYFYLQLPEERVGIQTPMAMILGGAIGNLCDRFVRGQVVDFLSFHWYDKWFQWSLWDFYGRIKLEWPAFNVADMAITTSVVWLLIVLAREKKGSSKNASLSI